MKEITNINGTFTLNNGLPMPYFGLGVFEAAPGRETIEAIHWAFEAGYRHIDTATMYLNEDSVGEAVRTSGLRREDVFITTKVLNEHQGYRNTMDAFQRSLEKLKTDYVDLYLIHWPVKGKYLETWQACEELYAQDLVRAIGVSNFLRHHIENIMDNGEIMPMVNQNEFHPYLVQPGLLAFCKEYHIQYQAWSPILKGEVNSIPVLTDIGKKYGKNPVQVVLRWDLQKEVITIPKSVHRERIFSNADIFDFELSEEDMSQIDALDRDKRTGPHPDSF
ncbi:MAG: aldo/keto reductase [Bacteroidales bacterium]|jgi:diketogulonate reductase-like aldo/keto reductase